MQPLVQAYWVVESAGLVERWTGVGLDSAEEVRERLTSSLLSGFALDLQSLFRTVE